MLLSHHKPRVSVKITHLLSLTQTSYIPWVNSSDNLHLQILSNAVVECVQYVCWGSHIDTLPQSIPNEYSKVCHMSFMYSIVFLFYSVSNCKHTRSKFAFSSSNLCLFFLKFTQTYLDVPRIYGLFYLCGIWLILTMATGLSMISWERSSVRHSASGQLQPFLLSGECGTRWSWKTDIEYDNFNKFLT